jgi:general secretion pathway protein C
MKRWPLLTSFVLFIALCASAAYWAMQLYKPPARSVAAPPTAAAPPDLRAAASLFGHVRRQQVVVASNYKLLGVIASGTGGDSVAILAADGKPAQAVRANREILPGVTVKEVHPRYVLLMEGGVEKRVELPEDAVTGAAPGNAPPRAAPPPQPAMPAPQQTIVPPQTQEQDGGAAPAPQVGGAPASSQPAMPSFGSAMSGVGGAPR